jgi:hypothetical protein
MMSHFSSFPRLGLWRTILSRRSLNRIPVADRVRDSPNIPQSSGIGAASERGHHEAQTVKIAVLPRWPFDMHHSRLCALLIDCKTSDVNEAAHFWSQALGRALDPDHPGSRGTYRMLETPPDEPIVQIQRVEHESRVHIDIETDDIPAEVARLEKLGATVAERLERWVVMQAPTGQRFCVVRIQRPGFPKNANSWD